MKSSIAIIFIVFVTIYGYCGDAQSAGLSDGGDFQVLKNPPKANDLQMAMADGGTVNLSDLKGKVVLLNFWRKNCQYCDMEKGYLKYLAKTINSNDLKVICANFWDPPSWVKSYAGKNGENLTIAAKPEGKRGVIENVVKGRIMGYYILNDANEAIYEVKGFPTTYIIDKSGNVVASHLGMAKWTTPGVKNWLAGLLGKPSFTQANIDNGPEWLEKLMLGQLKKGNF